MGDEIYIDWSKAPEGTTHAYTGISWESDGTPTTEDSNAAWEKWEDGKIFEYCNGRWVRYHTSCVLKKDRIARPEETPQPIERDKTYTLEVTGEELFLINLLIGKTNGSLGTGLFRKTKEMFEHNPINPANSVRGLPTIDLNSYTGEIAEGMHKVFCDEARQKAMQEYYKVQEEIRLLEEEKDKAESKLRALRHHSNALNSEHNLVCTENSDIFPDEGGGGGNG